ncbi:MAG TPA: hypothetical protein VFP10_03455 [Candidatus Eisenbacteria bacterium]|nr:hypothetical protein [Candidatus Eisenbacteria bacterium]
MTRPGPALVLPIGALASTAFGVWIGKPWLLPVLCALVPIPVFLQHIRKGRPVRAMVWVLYWCVAQSVAIGLLVAIAPERTPAAVWRGAAYTEEMFHYIRTGEGPEGSPRLFLPVHLRHYAFMCAISLATLGTGGLVLGTLLLNYMNVYVAELVRASAVPALAFAFGWPIWAVLRVVGYAATGAALADISWRMVRRPRRRRSTNAYRLLLFGVALVLLDILLKALLAPTWRGFLLQSLEASS